MKIPDPVRFLGNYSSGKMGVALAEQFAAEGAQVFLIAGPGTPETTNPSIERSPVTTAASMYDEVLAHYSNSDIVVMAAAVADFTIEKVAAEKIKKSGEGMTLRLVPTKDILKTLGESKEHQFLVGFALETENAEKHARAKLKNKNADLIVFANAADATKGSGFGVDTNKITISDAGGSQQNFAVKPKQQVARDIVNYIAEQVTIR
ncbi:MAG: phosphopantothenoylcysteine decarboxylase [Bacteroidales bacterium]|nr:phosphopantothenoylcysteine decarboxylase [Bacteroidales bacterium]